MLPEKAKLVEWYFYWKRPSSTKSDGNFYISVIQIYQSVSKCIWRFLNIFKEIFIGEKVSYKTIFKIDDSKHRLHYIFTITLNSIHWIEVIAVHRRIYSLTNFCLEVNIIVFSTRLLQLASLWYIAVRLEITKIGLCQFAFWFQKSTARESNDDFSLSIIHHSPKY